MQTFKAYRTFQDEKAVVSRFVDMKEDELDAGDVLIRTKYSTINYKDALSYNGAGKIMRASTRPLPASTWRGRWRHPPIRVSVAATR